MISKIICVIKIEDFDINDILIDEKRYKNVLVYNILYTSLIDSKPLYIRFNKIDGFISVYDGTRYLLLFGSEIYYYIYNRVRLHLQQGWISYKCKKRYYIYNFP